MISKTLHYVWVGRKEKPPKVIECMNTWKKYCPNYEIIEWNEEKFNINMCKYTKQAYEQGKYAFVSDVIRLFALYSYGGIYLDTDVEVFKPLDEFLKEPAFTGFENINYPVTAIMGAEITNPIIKQMLEYYIDKDFEWNGFGKTTTNTMIMSDILAKNGIDRTRNELQRIDNFTVYPKETFCPNWWENGINENNYTRHLMLGSWGDDKK